MTPKAALISVSNKDGIGELARGLLETGYQILSTGGTMRNLRAQGLEITPISEYTGHPEIMDGRVKTLHPKVHGGILARRDVAGDLKQMEVNGIKPIDVVVVNLYPFVETVSHPSVTLADAIENIDIGGPTMVRASAKNHKFVTIVVKPEDYPVVLDEIRKNGETSLETRSSLALKAFKHTAEYDAAIVEYLSRVIG